MGRSETEAGLDPFDAAVLVGCVAAVACAGLMALAVWAEWVHSLARVWPVFAGLSAVGWVTIGAWAPKTAPRGWQVAGLSAFVVVEALALTPMVALAWELIGTGVLAAGLATGMVMAGLTVFAIAKPTTYLEPIDPFIAVAIDVVAVLLVAIGFGLPLRVVWAVPLLLVTAVLALGQIASVEAHTREGQTIAGGARLFACTTALFAEHLYLFLSVAGYEDALWQALLG